MTNTGLFIALPIKVRTFDKIATYFLRTVCCCLRLILYGYVLPLIESKKNEVALYFFPKGDTLI